MNKDGLKAQTFELNFRAAEIYAQTHFEACGFQLVEQLRLV
jgi:hypothetical protein